MDEPKKEPKAEAKDEPGSDPILRELRAINKKLANRRKLPDLLLGNEKLRR